MTPEVITSSTKLTAAPPTTAVPAPTTTPPATTPTVPPTPGVTAPPPLSPAVVNNPLLTPPPVTTATAEPVIESRDAAISIAVTVAITAGLAVLASIATKQLTGNMSSGWIVWLAVAVGGLGGLTHEFAQSGGKILFFQRKVDGFYLGSLAGMVLGAVAGLLAVRGLTITQSATAASTGPIPIIFEVFFAGLALKGVAEAAGGQAVSSTPAPTGTMPSLNPTSVTGVLPPNVIH